jgi:hypothetical protein
MYCPQCGRELGLDSDVRFCRYCGLALSDTKDTLRGYTAVKREGYKFTNLSYVLLLGLFWIQYFDLIPWRSFRGGNFLLIVILGFIFGLWVAGNWVVDRPAKYVKNKRREETAESIQGEKSMQGGALPPSQGAPLPTAAGRRMTTAELVKPPSAAEDTTRRLTGQRPAD